MAQLDMPLRGLRIAILNISEMESPSRDCAVTRLAAKLAIAGYDVAELTAARDDDEDIRRQIQAWIDRGDIDLVLTTDASSFAATRSPPCISVTFGDEASDAPAAVVPDTGLGFVSVLNLIQARRFAA